jgi:hypothetical protein
MLLEISHKHKPRNFNKNNPTHKNNKDSKYSDPTNKIVVKHEQQFYGKEGICLRLSFK